MYMYTCSFVPYLFHDFCKHFMTAKASDITQYGKCM